MALLDYLSGGREPKSVEVPLFPLNTVLLPGSILALKVFEQRYVEMTKSCLKDNRPFGVCLIEEGSEVGTPAVPARVGCLATIIEWDMPQLGIFELKTVGTQRFRIETCDIRPDGLLIARITLMQEEPTAPLPDEHHICARVLRRIVDKLGSAYFREPFRFDDAAWVSYRLAETLPLKLAAKQKLLELDSSTARLTVLHKFLASQGLGE